MTKTKIYGVVPLYKSYSSKISIPVASKSIVDVIPDRSVWLGISTLQNVSCFLWGRLCQQNGRTMA
jgi:hypothetical protein